MPPGGLGANGADTHEPAGNGRGERALAAAARWMPGAIIAVAGLALVWSRLIVLSLSLNYDELHAITLYVNPGPSAIFSSGDYIAGNHMLFHLLSWATVNITGDHGEAMQRFWGVVPASAGVVIVTWWLWRRLDPWIAAIFAVIAVACPLNFDLGTVARGSGMEILSGALMLIGADRLRWSRSRHGFWLLVAGALIGILTVSDVVIPFLGLCAVLWLAPPLRRTVVRAVVVTGALSLAWYAPVLPGLLKATGQNYGKLLPWDAFITAPLKAVLGPVVGQAFTGLSHSGTEVVAAVLFAAGIVALLVAPERVLAALLLVPTTFTYLVFEVTGIHYAPRFVAFLILPLLVPVAVGLVALGRLPIRLLDAPGRPRKVVAGVAVALAAILSAIALNKIASDAQAQADDPIENVKEAATIVKSTGIRDVVAAPAFGFKLSYYLGTRVRFVQPKKLASEFCTLHAPFVYIEYLYGTANFVSTSCLVRRGAVRVPIRQMLNDQLTVWIVPAQAAARPAPAAAAPPSTSCTPTAAPRARGRSRPAPGGLLAATISSGFRVTERALGTQVLRTLRAPDGAGLTAALGELVAVRLRLSNVGHGAIVALDAVRAFSVRDRTGRAWQLADASCRGASAAYAAAIGVPLKPGAIISPGQSGTTAAVYAVPSATRLSLQSRDGGYVALRTR